MPSRTKRLSVLPWTGGLNTALDEGMIGKQDLVIFDNAVYGISTSKLKREGINNDFDDQSNGTDNIIGGSDFWYESGTSKTHKYVGVTETGVIYSWTTSGTRSTITPSATAEVCTILCATQANHGTASYFKIYSTNDAAKYAVWFDKSGADADPTPTGFTSTRVNISADVTAAQVATRLQGVLDALADFVATVNSATVTCTNATTGPCSNAENVTATMDTITTTIEGTSGAWTTPSKASFLVFQNILLMGVDGSSNNLMYWNGSTATALSLRTHSSYVGGDPAPPSASILREHLGRVFANDKSNKDRLHWSETFNAFKWQGAGDSGARDIGKGDGDPEGITAIFPTFRGDLFIAKKTKLYRMTGTSPEEFVVTLVSDSIGCDSHNSVVSANGEDMFWVSNRGVHSLNTTANFGDIETKFASYKIQDTFNEDFTQSRLSLCQGAYLPTVNSIAWNFTEDGGTIHNSIYLYNIPNEAWCRWPDMDAEALFPVQDTDQRRLYLGTSTTRLAKTFAGTNYDFNTSGTHVAIPYELETGLIFPEDNPSAVYGFKSFSLIHRPVGNQTISVSFKIDGYPEQALSFTVTGGVDLLGTTFILGTSILGTLRQLAPHTLSVDGYGRGFKVNISQSTTDQSAEIQGFAVEYEDAGDMQEVSG